MKALLASLVLVLVASVASAWDYVPIEQSRSYNAYRGPYWGGYYTIPARPIDPSYGPILQPMRYHSMYNWNTGDTWSGYSF